jgi:uncharacterized membrane protein YeiH
VGTVAVVVIDAVGGSENVGLTVATVLAMGLRFASLRFGWSLPVAKGVPPQP